MAYLRGRKAQCTYHQVTTSPLQVRTGVPQGSVISPALFNYFVSDCPLPDSAMASYADDFTLLASSPSIDEAEAEANRLMSAFVE